MSKNKLGGGREETIRFHVSVASMKEVKGSIC